ncbi:uncharacterized protein DSM5745_08211 [Aspergillus mulundensis]|uniref:DUF6314 domain-containing protein n=1 Tax=Aspergillus mulundensis TaxID=1810919 RepID=A0A3D8R9R8_9EURO|nr:Uncharacterized protein DSM5745_08211 [Aspergillus mulundensis]RDW70700.1 Uncharacterized protein DSM5745_08211 [Aspergillus mulundensis]
MPQPPLSSAEPTMPPRPLLQTIFSSLTRAPSPSTTPSTSTSTPPSWTLLRTLKSENPNDIQGDLHGTATFTPLPPHRPQAPKAENEEEGGAEEHTDLLYSESGSLPTSFGPGLRWTKKYIWRLSANGRISVWFVKMDKKPSGQSSDAEEADYLFHEFDFAATASSEMNSAEFVAPPMPPEVPGLPRGATTKVIAARGNHLCIDDMYRTAYAFRVDEGSGEVLSWASRHVVRGPKKGQDIVNLYSRAA